MIAHSGERRFDLGQQIALFFAGAEFIRTLTCVKSPGWRMCENGGMRLSAAQTASDTSAAVAPETRTVPFSSKRLIREWETLEAMIRIHCRDHHEAKAALCVECRSFWIMPGCGWNAAGLARKNRRAPSAPSIVISLRAVIRSRR